MNTHAEKIQENKSKPAFNMISGKTGTGNKTAFQFVDNRTHTVAQKKLKSMADKNLLVNHVTQLHANVFSQNLLQRKCKACEMEEESIQKFSSSISPLQLKGTIEQCEGYHADYKAKLPKKCTQNHTKAEMEANVVATQEHIDGRQKYIDEECDFVLPGSIAKGSDVALASHRSELDSVKKTLATCNDKILNSKYKK